MVSLEAGKGESVSRAKKAPLSLSAKTRCSNSIRSLASKVTTPAAVDCLQPARLQAEHFWSPTVPITEETGLLPWLCREVWGRLERLSYLLRAREWWCWDWSETARLWNSLFWMPVPTAPPATAPSNIPQLLTESPAHSYMGLVYRRPGRWLMQTQWAELQGICLGALEPVEAGKSQFQDLTNNITQKKKNSLEASQYFHTLSVW